MSNPEFAPIPIFPEPPPKDMPPPKDKPTDTDHPEKEEDVAEKPTRRGSMMIDGSKDPRAWDGMWNGFKDDDEL